MNTETGKKHGEVVVGSTALLGSVSDFKRYEGMFGCYAFYEAGVCIYVGKATCIYSRVKGHKLRFRNAERFSAWNLGRHIEGMDYANAHAFLSLMEAYFITVLDPLENVSRPEFMEKMWGAAKTIPAFVAVERLTNCFPVLLPNDKVRDAGGQIPASRDT